MGQWANGPMGQWANMVGPASRIADDGASTIWRRQEAGTALTCCGEKRKLSQRMKATVLYESLHLTSKMNG
jgi:hypothetical protein